MVDVRDQSDRNGDFIGECIVQLDKDGLNNIEVIVRQDILKGAPQKSPNTGDPEDQWPDGDEIMAQAEYVATVDEERRLQLQTKWSCRWFD